MNILRSFLAIIFIILSCGAASADVTKSRNEVTSKVRLGFAQKSYDKLEPLAERYRSEETRNSSGTWKLTSYYFVFRSLWIGDIINSPKDWSEMHKRIDAWAERYPQSPTPIIVRSIVLMAEAWKVRGTGYVKSVPPTAW